VHSVLGLLRLERAYYYCSWCGHGFCPRDQHLRIENTSLSPALTRMTGTVGALVSSRKGSELLTELAGVAVDAKQVERTAEALGQEISADERAHAEPSDTLALPRTLYLGMDGTGIPLRAEELAGRAGKQPDGSAKTGEVKLCTIWSADRLMPKARPSAMKGRSPTRRPWKALPRWILPPRALLLPSGFGEKLPAAVSPRHSAWPCSATALLGSGTSPQISFLPPFRSSTAFMPNST